MTISDENPLPPAENLAGSGAQPFYLTRNDSYGAVQPDDEYLHHAVNATVADDSLTETQYFGLEIPEHRIHVTCYLWHHVNLNTVTGGVWAFQGYQRQLQCEIFDIHAWMHNRVLADDLRRYRLPNGYGAEVIEPLTQHRLTYADPSRQNSVELEVTALNPAIMFADGRHFEQAMTVRGELMLQGTRYEVDCYNVRDRSWGKPRPEASMPMPPTGWMTAVFGEDFSFTCNAFDDYRLMPEWGGEFAIAEDKLLNGGWIYRDGEVVSVTRCIKRTERDPSTLFPTRIELEMTDATQETYHVTGTVLAASEWFVQPVLRWASVSVEWQCGNRVAFGEMQEAQWGDFTRAFMR
jgi:hypothetical protein